MQDTNIAIIEDETLVLNSLVGLLETRPEFKVVHQARNVEAFLEASLSNHPDVLLLDIGLKGGMTGLQGIRPIKQQYPNTDIIMLTTFDDSDRIFKALCAGASAYLTKRTPFVKIVEAIHTVQQGGSYMSPGIARKVVDYFAPKKIAHSPLTPRQVQIVDAIVEGLSYKMVADKLLITTETVRDHIKKIYRKLEVNSKTELIKKRIDGEI